MMSFILLRVQSSEVLQEQCVTTKELCELLYLVVMFTTSTSSEIKFTGGHEAELSGLTACLARGDYSNTGNHEQAIT